LKTVDHILPSSAESKAKLAGTRLYFSFQALKEEQSFKAFHHILASSDESNRGQTADLG
jgi:hypothetical protein